MCQIIYIASRNKGATIFLPIILPNADQFSKFFHRQLSSKVIIKYPTTPQTRHYTTWRNVYAQKWPQLQKNNQLYATAAIKNKDVMTKCLRTRSTFRHSVMVSVGTSKWSKNTSLILVNHGVKVTEGCYCNVICRYCPPCDRSQTRSSSFSKTVPRAHSA